RQYQAGSGGLLQERRGDALAIQTCPACQTQPLVLLLGDATNLTAVDKVGDADTAEKLVNLVAQILPQMLRETGFTLLRVTLALTFGSVHRFIHRVDDVDDANELGRPAQTVAPTGPAHAGHQVVAPQFREQLLEIGEGNTLTLGDICQVHRAGICMNRQIQQRSHGVSAFGCQTHEPVSRECCINTGSTQKQSSTNSAERPLIMKYLSNLVNYSQMSARPVQEKFTLSRQGVRLRSQTPFHHPEPQDRICWPISTPTHGYPMAAWHPRR